MMERDIYLDTLTGLPNYLKFMTEDLEEVFGNSGYVLMIKLKPMMEINENHGRVIGDKLLKFIGDKLVEFNSSYPLYRNEGNGFIVIYNDMNRKEASSLAENVKRLFKDYALSLGINEAFVYDMLFEYKENIKSVADFYKILNEEYKKEFNMSSEEVMSYTINKLSNTLKETVDNYFAAREFALHDDIADLPNYKSASMFLKNVNKYYDEYAIFFIDGDMLRQFNQVSYAEGNNAILKIAEMIKSSIRKTDNRGKDLLYPTTVSIGVAKYPNDGKTVQDVLKVAEAANKQAKDAGKNRVVVGLPAL